MGVDVQPVTGKKELEVFVRFPWALYEGDPHWVPPLIRDQMHLFDPGRNPFLAHGEIVPLIARMDDRVVGRIAAIRNRNHESFWGEPCGFFGFFECVDDGGVARALVEAARERCRQWGLDRMRGPVDPSTNDPCGTLVEGFDSAPVVLMPYGRPYYDGLLRSTGLQKARDLLAYWLVPPEEGTPERLRRGARLARQRNPGIRFRAFDKKNFAAEVERFKEVYNSAWEKNWGFVPMTDAEIDHMAAELKPVIDPGLIQIAEHGDRTVGFALAIPDMNRALRHANGRLFPFGLLKLLWHARRIDTARVLVLGVIEEYRGRGIDVVLYEQLYEYGIGAGYVGAELSWILEDNEAMRRPIEASMSPAPYKTYRIYEMAVGD